MPSMLATEVDVEDSVRPAYCPTIHKIHARALGCRTASNLYASREIIWSGPFEEEGWFDINWGPLDSWDCTKDFNTRTALLTTISSNPNISPVAEEVITSQYRSHSE